LKEQNPHEFASATDGLTEAQIARAQKRTEHGSKLSAKMGLADLDWSYHDKCRAKLTSSERATFDLEFIKARAVAGVRPAVDLALAAMRAKLMGRLGKPSWRAAT
jgi:hypothetical protein